MRTEEMQRVVKLSKINKMFYDEFRKEHDYNSAAEAPVTLANEMFDLVADELGLTGFQAGWAGLQLLAKINHIDCPFFIVKAEDYLYPQYDKKLTESVSELRPWLAEKAYNLLKSHGFENKARRTYFEDGEVWVRPNVPPDVWARWEKLATGYQEPEDRILTLCLTGK